MATVQPRLTLTKAGVARLAAEGRTDREVADLLAIRPKTVPTHLALVYRKLGVQSRPELALLLGAGAGDRAPANERIVEAVEEAAAEGGDDA